VLGAIFLVGTAREWHGLIVDDGLTIGTNLFGTPFYSLIGLHAGHVIVGLVILTLLCIFAFAGALGRHVERAELASWYWHFVDAVWVAVFTVVYVTGRTDGHPRAGDRGAAGANGLADGPGSRRHLALRGAGDERDRVRGGAGPGAGGRRRVVATGPARAAARARAGAAGGGAGEADPALARHGRAAQAR
jgi:hypothetical protein